MATDMATQWAETEAKLEQFKRDIHLADRQIALWRQFTAPAPALFDALKVEAVKAEALAGKLGPMLNDYEAGKGAARDFAEKMGEFAACWKRCQELYAAMHREAAVAAKDNPLLSADSPATASSKVSGARKHSKPKRKPKKR